MQEAKRLGAVTEYTEVLADVADARREAYRHTGRFAAGALDKLDSAKVADQFSYRLNKNGSLRKGLAEALPQEEFISLLDEVETLLKEIGTKIFAGATEVDPYRKGTSTACQYCDYRSICRIDPWTHSWRLLRAGKDAVEVKEHE